MSDQTRSDDPVRGPMSRGRGHRFAHRYRQQPPTQMAQTSQQNLRDPPAYIPRRDRIESTLDHQDSGHLTARHRFQHPFNQADNQLIFHHPRSYDNSNRSPTGDPNHMRGRRRRNQPGGDRFLNQSSRDRYPQALQRHDDNSRQIEQNQENNKPPPRRARYPRVKNEQVTNESSRISANNQELTNHNSNEEGRHEIIEKSNQKDIVESEFRNNNFECMICCDNIRRHNQIWCCTSCYNIFHLKCAVEWCNKSINSRNEAMAQPEYPSLSEPVGPIGYLPTVTRTQSVPQSDLRKHRSNIVEWPCPACREVLHSRPGKYKCFCGKVTNPDVNKHLIPHSCGQLCGRIRPNSNCPHFCNSLCHPGRCSPCSLTSNRSCYCGKLTKELKCSIATLNCDNVCGKPLVCGVHYCSKTCHSGSCESCEVVTNISCYCGKQKEEKRCDEINKPNRKPNHGFSCDIVCGKLLACRNHHCNIKCHPDPACEPCKLLNENLKNCPCGSSSIATIQLVDRKSCLEDVPTCSNKCNKVLICGPDKSRHRCQKKCHNRTCPPCKLKTTKFCRCKSSSRTVECSTMFKKIELGDGLVNFEQIPFSFDCDTKCNKLKRCGRHRCYNKCCKFSDDTSIHTCGQVCNKKLSCGSHNCTEICHTGQCGDCPNIGWEEVTCHCGASILYPPIPCGSKAPVCHRPCRREHNCDHPVKHECHDDSEKCAPCTMFVKKDCFCGAESKENVYCYQSGYSCGRTCKRKLACQQHNCKRICHENDCQQSNDSENICSQSCPKSRISCNHPCSLPCHGDEPCPPSECKKIVEISCKCGNKKDKFECRKMTKEKENRNKLAMMTNRLQNGADSVVIDLTKPLTEMELSCSDQIPLSSGKIECDETCVILERNRALAEALDISQPDLKPVNYFGDDPLRLLKEATVQDYKFVSSTYSSLVRFIKSLKDSDKRFMFTHFPAADRLRREIIHELAHRFHCTSETKGEEPFKHVVVRGHKTKSCIPDFTIEQLLPEDQQ